jgi:hypothetical protein
MESFWQHPKSFNCATVALIKVAILHYGVEEFSKQIKKMVITK